MNNYESKVREAREAKGVSQEKLAQWTDVSRETIRNIEKGASKPNVFLAQRIAELLDTTVDFLFQFKKDDTK